MALPPRRCWNGDDGCVPVDAQLTPRSAIPTALTAGGTGAPAASAILEESSSRATKDSRKEHEMADTTNQKLIPRTVVAGALALGHHRRRLRRSPTRRPRTGAAGTTAAATPATTLPAVGAASPLRRGIDAGDGPARLRSASAPTRRSSPATRSPKVTAAAKAKVPGGTIVRVETDADGHARLRGPHDHGRRLVATVYVDKSFNVVSVGAADDRRSTCSSEDAPVPT